jgi:very-short-patch-repair endonuclease
MAFSCGDCGRTYKTIAGLKKHKQIAHGRKAPKKRYTPRKTYNKSVNKKASIKGKSMEQIREGLMDSMSQLERDFGTLLQMLGLQYESQYQLGTKFFDFYLPAHNTIIEVDGDYYHCNPEIYKKPQYKTQRRAIINDHRKNRLCEQHGIRLIRFWENDIRNKRDMVLARLMLALNII